MLSKLQRKYYRTAISEQTSTSINITSVIQDAYLLCRCLWWPAARQCLARRWWQWSPVHCQVYSWGSANPRQVCPQIWIGLHPFWRQGVWEEPVRDIGSGWSGEPDMGSCKWWNGDLGSTGAPVRSGRESSGGPLYVGRAQIKGTWTVGKVKPEDQTCYVSYGGEEHAISSYEVLCVKELELWGCPCHRTILV